MPVIENTPTDDASEGEDDELSSRSSISWIRVSARPSPWMAVISFSSFEEGVVTLYMRGACQGCTSSAATLKMGTKICCGTTFLRWKSRSQHLIDC